MTLSTGSCSGRSSCRLPKNPLSMTPVKKSDRQHIIKLWTLTTCPLHVSVRSESCSDPSRLCKLLVNGQIGGNVLGSYLLNNWSSSL